MAIIKETVIINEAEFVKHYSNTTKCIKQVETGNLYFNAIDLPTSGYTYIETDELIDIDEPPVRYIP